MKDSYSGRGPNTVPKTLSLHRRAAELLEKRAASKNNQGAYVSNLLFADEARIEGRQEGRQEERERLRRLLEEGSEE